MKFLSGKGKSISSVYGRIICTFLLAMLINLPALASKKLTELSVSGYGSNGLVLFPSHNISEFKVSMETPEVFQADIYDYKLEGGSRILPTPHPMVKFMRISQISSSPDVVRATLVFNSQVKVSSKCVDNKLVIETSDYRKIRSFNLEQRLKNRKTDMIPSSELRENSDCAFRKASENSESVLEQRISLNFANEDLLSILNALASKLDLRIFADKGVKGKMSVNAKDVTLRDVLKNLLLQRNYQYTLKGRDLTVISLKNDDSSRVAKELLFKDLSLKDALQTVSKIMNINLILHESVEDKKVNFYVENLNLDELLDVLIDTNGLVKKPHNENTFIICSKESAGDFEKKQFKTFKLVNAKPEEIINMINKSKSLSERIKTENFSVNDRINSISVYDSPENLSLIAKIIEGADEKVQQIVIEVKLIEVNPASAKKLGLSFSENSTKVFNGNKLPENNIGEKDLSITAVLDLLEREKKVKLISSPKIRTVHGKSASISIGKVYPVPSYKYENASNSYLGHIPQIYKEYRDLEVGIKLEVTPEISRDNEISMDLKTVVEDVVGEANEDGQYKRLQRTTSSHVRIKNGETVVVGGLISANDDVAKQSSSLFNRIHLFKNMTTRNNATAQRGEVIMLVTPRLVNLDGADDDCADDIYDVSEGVY